MQPGFGLNDVVKDDVIASRDECGYALMNSAKHGRTHGIPRKFAIPDLLDRKRLMIQKQIKGKANKWYIQMLL